MRVRTVRRISSEPESESHSCRSFQKTSRSQNSCLTRASEWFRGASCGALGRRLERIFLCLILAVGAGLSCDQIHQAEAQADFPARPSQLGYKQPDPNFKPFGGSQFAQGFNEYLLNYGLFVVDGIYGFAQLIVEGASGDPLGYQTRGPLLPNPPWTTAHGRAYQQRCSEVGDLKAANEYYRDLGYNSRPDVAGYNLGYNGAQAWGQGSFGHFLGNEAAAVVVAGGLPKKPPLTSPTRPNPLATAQLLVAPSRVPNFAATQIVAAPSRVPGLTPNVAIAAAAQAPSRASLFNAQINSPLLPRRRIVVDVACGRNGSLAAPLLPGDVVIGIDPLLEPGKVGLRCSIFDQSVLEEFRGACDEIILTGCKTGRQNKELLERTCSELLRPGGRVTVIDQYRGRAMRRTDQNAFNPDTTFYTTDGPLQLIDGCSPRGHYPLPEWAKGLKFYNTDGCQFPSTTYWRAWVYYKK